MILAVSSAVSVLISVIIFFMVYSCLYIVDRKPHTGIWSLAWLAFSTKSIFLILILVEGNSTALVLGEKVAYAISIYLVVLGTYYFTEKKMPKILIFLFVLNLLYIVISILSGLPFMLHTIPSYMVNSIMYLWIGIKLLGHTRIREVGRVISGWAAVAWGIHAADYPFLVGVKWFMPYGYFLSSLIFVIFSSGILHVCFKTFLSTVRESEQRLKTVTGNMMDIICQTDKEGMIQYISPSVVNVLGYEDREVLGKSCFIHIHPDDRERVIANFTEVIDNLLPKTVEHRYMHIAGHFIWFESSANMIFNSGGKVSGVIISARDITLRKEMDQLLKDSEEKYRTLLFHSNDAILLHEIHDDGKPGRILEANNKACTQLGYSREELLELTPWDFTISDTEVNSLEVGKEILSKSHLTFERIAVSKSGSRTPIEVSSHMFNLKDERVVLAVMRDISERKKGEELLKQSEKRYRQLVELSPDGILTCNESGITFINRAGVKLLGAKRKEDVIGKAFLDFIYLERRQKFLDRIGRLIRHERKKRLIEERILRLDGDVIDVEITVSAIEKDNEQVILAIMRDITERKHAEELRKSIDENNRILKETLELDRLRSEFFTNLSHELRTPLNLIFSTVQLLTMNLKKDESNSSKTLRYIGIMRQNCYRLLRLVNNLIDITKIDSGYLELQIKNCDIVRLVEDIAMSVSEYMETKGLTMEFDTEMEERIMACDPDKIERIFLNLLSNATKFTPPGGKISVNIYDKGNAVQISVRDTGIGIPEDKQQQIFERFRQVDQSLTRSSEGSGIGLSLVKALVEMHGGTIKLQSSYGKGSYFIVTIPAVPASKEAENMNGHDVLPGNIEKINIEFSDIYN